MDPITKELACIEKIVGGGYPDDYDMLIVQHCIKKIQKLTRDPQVLARVADIERAQQLLEHAHQEYDLIMRRQFDYYSGARRDPVKALKMLAMELAPEELHWHPGVANMYERVKCAIEVLSSY